MAATIGLAAIAHHLRTRLVPHPQRRQVVMVVHARRGRTDLAPLCVIHGVGDIIAGKILGHIDDVTRFPTADHLASYTGTSPLEASSGDRRRHRLNTTGNRRLNTAIHTVAVCQARDPGPGRVYYLRKIAEGKTPAEARRALKRRLTNVLYRHILKDQQRRLDATT